MPYIVRQNLANTGVRNAISKKAIATGFFCLFPGNFILYAEATSNQERTGANLIGIKWLQIITSNATL